MTESVLPPVRREAARVSLRPAGLLARVPSAGAGGFSGSNAPAAPRMGASAVSCKAPGEISAYLAAAAAKPRRAGNCTTRRKNLGCPAHEIRLISLERVQLFSVTLTVVPLEEVGKVL